MSDSQLADLQNMRMLLQEARDFARELAYHRRVRLEAVLGRALEEVDHHPWSNGSHSIGHPRWSL
jgi:hypothetical protein